MSARGILPTERPDDIAYADWVTLLVGQYEIASRAMARIQVLVFVRPMRRLRRWWAWFTGAR